ncbi:MAG: ion channel [Acidimicrobiales bacterium]
MTGVLVAAGAVLVTVALVDVAWTTVTAGSGAGPLTSRLARRLWRLALALHGRRPSHVLLSVAGVTIVFAVLATWIALALAGWALVFGASDGAVRTAETGTAADLVARLYFTGYSVFTLGNGDYAPGEGAWQLATVLATGTGLMLVTLSISYLVPVASAVAQRRQLAIYIASLGTSPHEILARSWTGVGFGSLAQHLVSLTPLVHAAHQSHLAYPVLHYFHSQDRQSAAAPNLANLANLAQALHLLRHGVAPDIRPDPAALAPLDAALGLFLDTVRRAFLGPSSPPLDVPPLGPLRAAGVPVVDDANCTYQASAPATEQRRARLADLLVDDGWPTDEGS